MWRVQDVIKIISTHAPRTGSDYAESAINPAKLISTHAPRTGSDGMGQVVDSMGRDFNPRSPHGERPRAVPTSTSFRRFQPTLPARGATNGRHPTFAVWEFQPTLPARGATDDSAPKRFHVNISTHAPRTGSDRQYRPITRQRCYHFNPRSPHGERRAGGGVFRRALIISTHAPRTGSDAARRADGR